MGNYSDAYIYIHIYIYVYGRQRCMPQAPEIPQVSKPKPGSKAWSPKLQTLKTFCTLRPRSKKCVYICIYIYIYIRIYLCIELPLTLHPSEALAGWWAASCHRAWSHPCLNMMHYGLGFTGLGLRGWGLRGCEDGQEACGESLIRSLGPWGLTL